MALTRCPGCNALVEAAGPPRWTIWVACCSLPFGAILPFIIKRVTVCSRCGYRFEA
jgi:hypothetical protein